MEFTTLYLKFPSTSTTISLPICLSAGTTGQCHAWRIFAPYTPPPRTSRSYRPDIDWSEQNADTDDGLRYCFLRTCSNAFPVVSGRPRHRDGQGQTALVHWVRSGGAGYKCTYLRAWPQPVKGEKWDFKYRKCPLSSTNDPTIAMQRVMCNKGISAVCVYHPPPHTHTHNGTHRRLTVHVCINGTRLVSQQGARSYLRTPAKAISKIVYRYRFIACHSMEWSKVTSPPPHSPISD